MVGQPLGGFGWEVEGVGRGGGRRVENAEEDKEPLGGGDGNGIRRSEW